jgi:hypothetical protein
MREVFHGWRRKLGCITLMLACLATLFWVRSFRHNDEMNFWTGPLAVDSLNSSPMGLCWMSRDKLAPNVPMLSGRFGWVATQTFANDICDPFRWSTTSYHFRWCGFQFAEATINPPDRGELRIWIIPHWALALPLTLLSAGLILWQPRKQVNRDA